MREKKAYDKVFFFLRGEINQAELLSTSKMNNVLKYFFWGLWNYLTKKICFILISP
jgi:hypothetical protein